LVEGLGDEATDLLSRTGSAEAALERLGRVY
jgi:hypothetical protein